MKSGGQESKGRPWARGQGTDVVAGTQERKGIGGGKEGLRMCKRF